MKEGVNYLESLVEEINEFYGKSNKLFDPELIDSTYKVAGFIDVAEKLEEYILNL
jgi:hypothetical protein